MPKVYKKTKIEILEKKLDSQTEIINIRFIVMSDKRVKYNKENFTNLQNVLYIRFDNSEA